MEGEGEQNGPRKARVLAASELLYSESSCSCSGRRGDCAQVTVTEAAEAEMNIVAEEILCPWEESRGMAGECMPGRCMARVGERIGSHRRRCHMRNSLLLTLFVTHSQRRPADLRLPVSPCSIRSTSSGLGGWDWVIMGTAGSIRWFDGHPDGLLLKLQEFMKPTG